MSWFSDTKVRVSDKNGTITAKRHFGKWIVLVNGCEQTGPEVHAMWRDAFDKIGSYFGGRKVKRVLALGLGGGGEIKNIYRHFPNAELTVVEYDPEMISLAKELGLYRPYPFPQVVCEDAKISFSRLPDKYDLIILDLFFGAEPSPLVTDSLFISELASKLNADGLIVANVFRNKEYIEKLSERLLCIDKWKFSSNHLGLFKTGTQKTNPRYVPRESWPEYDPLAGIPSALHPSWIGRKQRGINWHSGPFSFEEYQGDEEPPIEPLPKNIWALVRVVIWQRFSGSLIPPAWISYTRRPHRKTGYSELSSEYQKAWSETARRDLRKWERNLSGTKYVIEPVSVDEFSKEYLKSTIPFYMRRSMSEEIRTRSKNKVAPITLYGVRRIKDGALLAGIALMYSPSLRISHYLAGFHHKETEGEPLMTGLFDHWFRTSLEEGAAILDFGNFWLKGDPSSWKGFSQFKAKFGPHFFYFPPRLYRFLLNR